MEYRLVEGIRMSSQDIDDAKTKINIQINPKALAMAGINPVAQISKPIWRATGQVLRGQIVECR